MACFFQYVQYHSRRRREFSEVFRLKRVDTRLKQKNIKESVVRCCGLRERRYEMEIGYVVGKKNTGHFGVFGASFGHNAASSC